jgi:hypothetical protein
MRFISMLVILLIASPAFAKPIKKPSAAKASASAAANGGQERFIVREQRMKNRDQKDVNFDDVSISGARKAPMSSLISNTNANKDHDFIKIRLRWHPEMVQSASSLDFGAVE